MSECFVFMYKHTPHSWCLHRLKEDIRYPENKVTVVCELPYGHWKKKKKNKYSARAACAFNY